jgi:hypothetical protein
MHRTSLAKALLPLTLGFAALGSVRAEEARLTARLTTTDAQALYGVAVLRSSPEAEADVVTKLVPGAAITVYPDTSPEGWWFVVMKTPDGHETAGYVPRDFVRMSTGPFRDVPGDHQAADALRRLKDSGEMKADAVGDFRGEDEVTRFQLAVILDRALGRVRAARAAIDDQIARLPEQIELARDISVQVGQLIEQSDALRKEQAALEEQLATMGDVVARQGEQLAGATVRFEAILGTDHQQSRRLRELEHTTRFLGAQVDALRRQQLAYRTEAGMDHLMGLEESLEVLEGLDESTGRLEKRLEKVERLREVTGISGVYAGLLPGDLLDHAGE